MDGTPQTNEMMALGLFVFSLQTTPYQQLQRAAQWRHASTSRVGQRPGRQFVGQGDDSITLSGVLYPGFTGGRMDLEALRKMADEGKSWPLVEGSGYFYGLYVIEDITETHSVFFRDGAARKIEFTLKLTRVDDEPALMGDVSYDVLDMFGAD